MNNMVVRRVQSFEEWRVAARGLIASGVPPAAVQWQSPASKGDLFSGAMEEVSDDTTAYVPADAPALRLPRHLVKLLECAACYSATDRWAFLYQVTRPGIS